MTPRPPLTILVTAALMIGLAGYGDAQVVGQEASALANVPAVDAQVAITWSDEITAAGGPGEARYAEAFEAEFKRGLRGAGIKIDATARNYLYCSIVLLHTEGDVVAAQSIEYHEPMGSDGQWAITWTLMQVYTVPLGSFGGQDDAQWCHQRFVEDWREGNG